jgi:leader peptidase (prepilin peptidase)/N-methyltransferase
VEIIGIYLFVIGCCIGSFINVLIYRLPLNQSIVYPNSSCPKCNAKIKWFDNLPIISWLLLRGKCRACKSKISFSYPIIELSTGLLVWLNFYANPTIYSQLAEPIILFCGTILSSILITLAILDFKYFWLPQAITIGGLMLGITYSLIIDLSNDFGQFSYSLYSLTALLLGLALFYLLSYVGLKSFNKQSLTLFYFYKTINNFDF